MACFRVAAVLLAAQCIVGFGPAIRIGKTDSLMTLMHPMNNMPMVDKKQLEIKIVLEEHDDLQLTITYEHNKNEWQPIDTRVIQVSHDTSVVEYTIPNKKEYGIARRVIVTVQSSEGGDTISQLDCYFWMLRTDLVKYSASGCAVYPGEEKPDRAPGYRGHALRRNVSTHREAEACLTDAFTLAIVSNPVQSFTHPLVNLWRLFRDTSRVKEQQRTLQLLKRTNNGKYYLPISESPIDIGMNVDVTQAKYEDLSHLAHLQCAYSGSFFLNVNGWESEFAVLGHPHGQHYKLLSYIARHYPPTPGGHIVDVGTRHGASSVAFSNGKDDTTVTSFDLHRSQLNENILMCNKSAQEFYDAVPVTFVDGNVLDEEWREMLMFADVIFLDTLHDGPFEWEMYNYLYESGYKGYLILDDIYLNRPMEMFWGAISEPKVDLTHYGHSTGTGLVYFPGHTLDVGFVSK